MKKTIIIIVVVIIALLAYGVYWSNFSMSINRLPKGELISETKSPNGTYTVKAYLVNSGATMSYSIRVELNYNTIKKKPKNIYWDYRIEKAKIEWIDDNTVIINGVKLKVPYEKFDWRRESF